MISIITMQIFNLELQPKTQHSLQTLVQLNFGFLQINNALVHQQALQQI